MSVKQRLRHKLKLKELDSIKMISDISQLTEDTLKLFVDFWWANEAHIEKLKNTMELILNKGRKLEGLDLKFYNELVKHNGILRDNIIDFSLKNGYTLVKIEE